MSTEHVPQPDRMTHFRKELVATVEAARYTKPRFAPRSVIAAIAAFALAGAVTGGAISATAIPTAPDSTLTVDVESMAQGIVGTHAQLFGTPVVIAGNGKTLIDLGKSPDGATSIAIALNCVDAGDFTIAINGEIDSTMSCTEEAAESNREHSVGMGGQHTVKGTGRQELTIDSPSSSHYVVWVSWSAEAKEPDASEAQQAEMADGQASREEYVAAFDRFAACMSEAGQPVIGGDKSGTLIDYSTTDAAAISGIDTQCYVAEFQQVDVSWQIANEDSSAGTLMLKACLVAAGITPAPTTAEVVAQVQAAGLLESCH